ncbi:DUF2235 domain-containing protein [Cupriavidus sp. DL-D2]|uniref:phospholipase effector Tle1 domain-containing protein n=1 Tax=Cupriavidus sp. DL-D2 TaxID=3144974 RepID=UPI0032160088
MNILRWPARMPETGEGRLPESLNAFKWGEGKVTDPLCSCERTLHISLFFDGTNNNDDENNEWRDSQNEESHTNVARLFNAAIEHPEANKFKFYIVGVGTPFPEIGEHTYHNKGKAFAKGFAKRCAWGYTRVLSAIYVAIMGSTDATLMDDPTAKKICEDLDKGRQSPDLKYKENIVAISQRNRKEDGQRNRVIKHVWINVFGFSRAQPPLASLSTSSSTTGRRRARSPTAFPMVSTSSDCLTPLRRWDYRTRPMASSPPRYSTVTLNGPAAAG